MKVLYTTTVPAPYKVDMFEELGKLCELTVIFEKDELSYRANGWMKKEFKNFKAVFLKGISFKDRMFSKGIIDIVRSQNFDHIIIGVYSTPSSMLAMEYMKLRNIPYILSSDGGMVKKDSFINRKVKERYIGSAVAWLSTGKVTTAYLSYYGANELNIFTYPFSSIKEEDVMLQDLSKDEILRIRSKLCIKEEYCIVSVGQFVWRKGFDVLLKAATKINNNIGIYIIGGEPTEEYLKIKDENALDNVHFVGFKSKLELAEYYKAADIFVLPTREDIWGLVVNESLAYGLPVITTDKCVAGIELLNDGVTGTIIPVEDELALANEINIEIAQCRFDRKMCRRKALEYTIETMAFEHYNILKKLEKR